MLIDGSVQIAPFAADLDIGLINPDRAAMGSTKLPQPFLDDRCISQYPAVDRAMIDLEAPLAKHLFQVTIAERVAQVPGNRLGTVAKLAMRQPFVLFKGLTFQKLCLPGAFRPGITIIKC